tara:strand:+ start:36179 stop:36802 length:624 start_codon:yes stop_codon:yes gene_type:complete
MSASWFPINTVKVTGEYPHINRQALQDVVVPDTDHGFFAMKMNKIKHHVEQLPWVAKADVKRVWPDKLVIHINEKQAAANWNKDSILTNSGEVFTPLKGDTQKNLPKLTGPAGQELEVFREFNTISQQLQPLGLTVTELRLSPRNAWRMKLSNGLEVVIGHSDVNERVTRFVKAYPKVIDGRDDDVVYVDLRYPHGMAVRWRGAKQA